MNAEHLLDAIGLLDDDLIQEAEGPVSSKETPNYRAWMGWAACLAVVIVLHFAIPHLGSFGSGANSGGASSPPKSSESSGGAGWPGASNGESADPTLTPDEPSAPSSSAGWSPSDSTSVDEFGPPEGIPQAVGDWCAAIMVDGTVYWSTEEFVKLTPEESRVRYTTAPINGEPEEEGQTNFAEAGVPYTVLEDGTVAVRWNGETGTWCIFIPVPPGEQ